MKNGRLLLKRFVLMLSIFLMLWGAVMGAAVWRNSQWSREDISRRMNEYRMGFQRNSQLTWSSGTHTGIVYFGNWDPDRADILLSRNTYLLGRYGGQLVSRAYDKDGTRLGQSQLLTAWITVYPPGDTVHFDDYDLLFDPVMTDEQQVTAARILEKHPWLIGSEPYGNPEQDSFGGADITGWQDGTVLYPQKVVLNFANGPVTLMESESDFFRGKELTEYHAADVQIYDALVGAGGPEKRLEAYRAMEGQLDQLAQYRTEGSALTMLGDGVTSMTPCDEMDLAVTYQLPDTYYFYGLGPLALTTLAAAVALALFTAWLEYRAIQQERAFVRGAAHELKTPLAVVRTHAEALREDIDPDKREQYLDTVVAESDRMAALVGNLLHLSRLESGQMLDKEPLDFAALVEGRAERLALPAEQKGIALHTQLGPAAMLGDRLALEEVVDNLLDNALSHCTPGGTVTVTLVRKGRQINLTVDNDGDPIPPEHIDHLFEPFYRGDAGRSRADGGAGLGLAIVRGAVEAHGGRCWAVNRTGGVSFTVLLPGLQSER